MNQQTSIEERDRYFMHLAQRTAVERDTRSGALLVLRNAEVSALLSDPRLQNEEREDSYRHLLAPEHLKLRSEFRRFLRLWPAFSDGEYHARMRTGLAEALPKSLDAHMSDLLGNSAIEMLNKLIGQQTDWVQDFAHPYATEILGNLICPGESETAAIAQLGVRIITTMAESPSTVEGILAALSAADKLEDWLKANMSRSSPLLIQLRRLGDEFGMRAATAAFAQVVTGTVEPLVTVLSVLAEKVGPREFQEVPTSAIREEVIRLATPFRFAGRSARCPLEVGDYRVAEGDRISLDLAAANMDPLAVPDPLAIANRARLKHLAFSAGSHYCLGAGITRVAVDIVLDYMKSRKVSYKSQAAICTSGLPTLRYLSLPGVLSPWQESGYAEESE